MSNHIFGLDDEGVNGAMPLPQNFWARTAPVCYSYDRVLPVSMTYQLSALVVDLTSSPCVSGVAIVGIIGSNANAKLI